MRELSIEEQGEVGGGWFQIALGIATLIGGVWALVEMWEHFNKPAGTATVEVGPLKTLQQLGGDCQKLGNNLKITIDGKTVEYQCTVNSDGTATISSPEGKAEITQNGEFVDIDFGDNLEPNDGPTDDGDNSGDDSSDGENSDNNSGAGDESGGGWDGSDGGDIGGGWGDLPDYGDDDEWERETQSGG